MACSDVLVWSLLAGSEIAVAASAACFATAAAINSTIIFAPAAVPYAAVGTAFAGAGAIGMFSASYEMEAYRTCMIADRGLAPDACFGAYTAAVDGSRALAGILGALTVGNFAAVLASPVPVAGAVVHVGEVVAHVGAGLGILGVMAAFGALKSCLETHGTVASPITEAEMHEHPAGKKPSLLHGAGVAAASLLDLPRSIAAEVGRVFRAGKTTAADA